MTKSEKRTLRSALESERDQLLADLDSIVARSRGLHPDVAVDIFDLAQEDSEERMIHLLAARDQQRLSEIELALEHIDSPSFGRCSQCGGPIGKARLRVLPSARHCLPCQEEAESGRESGDHPQTTLWRRPRSAPRARIYG